MESQPQNPEFRINPENFHPWKYHKCKIVLMTLKHAKGSLLLKHGDKK